MDIYRKIAQLAIKYTKKTITPEELQELHEWAQQSEHNRYLFEHLTNEEYWAELQAIDMDEVWKTITGKKDTPFTRKMMVWKKAAISAASFLITIHRIKPPRKIARLICKYYKKTLTQKETWTYRILTIVFIAAFITVIICAFMFFIIFLNRYRVAEYLD